MLKKQTVWLLTMLSLMIVLSVYYMSSPNGEELAFINQDSDNEQTTNADVEGTDSEVEGADAEVEGEESTETSSTSTDQLFTEIRMQVQDERSKRLDYLDDIVASSNTSTDEKNQAYDEMQEIESVAVKESILEEEIKAEKNYEDVLVRYDSENVIVTVKADEMSKEDANHIMQMARDEFGTLEIEVKFQPIS